MRVLVVEDEILVSMLTEDLLGDLGHQVAAVAYSVATALSACGNGIDFAVLDVNLGGEQSFPIADHLEQQNVPYIFVTGYGQSGIKDRYRCHQVLTKPFTLAELRDAMAAELGRLENSSADAANRINV